jgi:hypothetical protein
MLTGGTLHVLLLGPSQAQCGCTDLEPRLRFIHGLKLHVTFCLLFDSQILVLDLEPQTVGPHIIIPPSRWPPTTRTCPWAHMAVAIQENYHYPYGPSSPHALAFCTKGYYGNLFATALCTNPRSTCVDGDQPKGNLLSGQRGHLRFRLREGRAVSSGLPLQRRQSEYRHVHERHSSVIQASARKYKL